MADLSLTDLASATGVSLPASVHDCANAATSVALTFPDDFEVGSVDSLDNLSGDQCTNVIQPGENFRVQLQFSSEATYFTQRIKPRDSNYNWQYVRGSSLVTFVSQNGPELEFTADSSGTFEVEMELADGFNLNATGYKTFFSEVVEIDAEPFNVNVTLQQDNDPTYTFTASTPAQSPSFQWDLGPTAEYIIDSGSLTSQTLTATFSINDPSKTIRCDVTDTCGNTVSDQITISIDNAGAA